MEITYVHPKLKTLSSLGNNGILSFESTQDKCHLYNNCYDFTSIHSETLDADHYNKKYASVTWLNNVKLNGPFLRKIVKDNSAYQLLFDSLGDVKGKKVLLLGNGMSAKELFLLEKGAHLFYTDISLEAILAIKNKFEESEMAALYGEKIVFQAVDAIFLPYAENSFDIIYGCAFVHHLEQLDVFFKDLYRVLKPGGKCLFLDDAYSGWWQWSKKTFLRPLQLYTHRKGGISPEDLRATMRGGYKRSELENLMYPIGFRSLIYKRTMFFEHFFRRGALKLLSKKLMTPMAKLGKFFDKIFFPPKRMSRRGILLVWGAKK